LTRQQADELYERMQEACERRDWHEAGRLAAHLMDYFAELMGMEPKEPAQPPRKEPPTEG
jgi:hypothetical protein